MGWAAENLSADERLVIAGGLFRVDDRASTGAEVRGHCPFHEDANPSFAYNLDKDVWGCLNAGCPGHAGGDLVALFARTAGLGDRAGFIEFKDRFAPDHGGNGNGRGARGNGGGGAGGNGGGKIPPGPPLSKGDGDGGAGGKAGKVPPFSDLAAALAKMDPLPPEWVARLERERGWTAEGIERLGIRLLTWFPDREGGLTRARKADRLAIPVFGHDGALVNILRYKPWDRRTFEDGRQEAKIFSWGEGFGRARLFPLQVLAPSPSPSPILLAEGVPDAICAFCQGFNALTQTSKTKAANWPAPDIEVFRGREVVIAYDADQPGDEYAAQAAAALRDRAGVSPRILTWPDSMGRDPETGKWPEKHGQDLTDFIVRHGKTAADLRELVGVAPGMDSAPAVLESPIRFFERGMNDRLSFKPILLSREIMERERLVKDPKTGVLYRWDGRVWEPWDPSRVESVATLMLGNEYNQGRVVDARRGVEWLCSLPDGREMDDRPHLLTCENGTLDLRDLTLHPHNPDDFSTFCMAVPYSRDAGIPNAWWRYLGETVQDEGPAMVLQEFMGSCFLRETAMARCLFLHGPGSDGKSLFIKILQALVGEKNTAAVGFADLDKEFSRVGLYRKWLNAGTEIPSDPMGSSAFKALVTGDPIRAAYKGHDGFEFVSHAKMIFAMNRLPRILDHSDGLYRRIIIVPFKRQFLGKDADPDLEGKLLAELPGIFLWALEGYRRLVERRAWTECEETSQAMLEYRKINSNILAFVDEQCVFGDGFTVEKAKLYSKYREWCGENGNRPMSNGNFFMELYSAKATVRAARLRIGEARLQVVEGLTLAEG